MDSIVRHVRQSRGKLISLVLLIPVGFSTKLYNGPAENWIHEYSGGILYVIFWCLFISLLISTPPWRIASGVFLVTCLLEWFQLWNPPLLSFLRGTLIGRTLLGTTFDWWDFPHYILGSLGWIWIAKMTGRPPSEFRSD